MRLLRLLLLVAVSQTAESASLPVDAAGHGKIEQGSNSLTEPNAAGRHLGDDKAEASLLTSEMDGKHDHALRASWQVAHVGSPCAPQPRDPRWPSYHCPGLSCAKAAWDPVLKKFCGCTSYMHIALNKALTMWTEQRSLAMSTYGHISEWDVSDVACLNRMADASKDCSPELRDFNEDINAWDVSKVTSMIYAFDQTAFNRSLDKWDFSKVRSFQGMFFNAKFNQNVDSWDVSSAENMNDMFYGDGDFEQSLDAWKDKLSNLETFDEMLEGTSTAWELYQKGIPSNFILRCWDVKAPTWKYTCECPQKPKKECEVYASKYAIVAQGTCEGDDKLDITTENDCIAAAKAIQAATELGVEGKTTNSAEGKFNELGFRFDQPPGGYKTGGSSRPPYCTLHSGNKANPPQFFAKGASTGSCGVDNFHCLCKIKPPPAPSSSRGSYSYGPRPSRSMMDYDYGGGKILDEDEKYEYSGAAD